MRSETDTDVLLKLNKSPFALFITAYMLSEQILFARAGVVPLADTNG
jgi:hypothetical protein